LAICLFGMIVNQFEVKSCNALLRVLPVRVGSYLKPLMRYKYLILYTCHPDTLYFHTQGCEDPWMLFAAKMGPLTKKKVGETMR
jgi:hypothetical protein